MTTARPQVRCGSALRNFAPVPFFRNRNTQKQIFGIDPAPSISSQIQLVDANTDYPSDWPVSAMGSASVNPMLKTADITPEAIAKKYPAAEAGSCVAAADPVSRSRPA